MTNILLPAKRISKIIESTKAYNLNWINMSDFKDYLHSRDLSLNEIPPLHRFLEYLQFERYIFDCMDTYISYNQGEILVFSKSKYSYEYRLDFFETHSIDPKWQGINTNLSMLLRLRNAIVATDIDEEDYEEFFQLICSDCLV